MVNLDCEETAARLDKIAAELGGATRAQECSRILREAQAVIQPRQPLVGGERVQAFSLAFQDASMIVAAFEALADSEIDTARQRLREAVSGNTVVVPAAGNDESRNHLWTVFLAGLLQKQGLAPRFADATTGEQGVKKPDLFTTIDGTSLAIEAKRVRSYAKLGKHVRKAVKQIAAACDNGDTVAGFLALDVSFAVEQHGQSGLWFLQNRTALPDVRRELAPKAMRLFQTVDEYVRAEPGAHHIVGATILMLPVMHYNDSRQLGLVRYFATSPLTGDRSVAGRAAYKALHERCFADR